ncbi:MAG: prefoldin subunit beta [Promethearchaeota archaeon]
MTLNLDNLDEETRNKLMNLQNLSQSLEFLTNQRLQMEATLRETEIAIEELSNVPDDTPVYKSIGGILVKSKKNKLIDEKKNLKVTLDMRIKTIKQKEDRSKQQLETLRKSLQSDLQNK